MNIVSLLLFLSIEQTDFSDNRSDSSIDHVDCVFLLVGGGGGGKTG